ncbi:NAD(P)-dependent dehydrogenase, short-chain alcohol dehydrogenase family [Pseudoxanthobacter soli DSM 19599]|uniref:NAD(P)-dependent dehydrogenase, short-chain alcohol dehydrogenase family n=1 Tax=Pseudoxanthobacter soli DSM 19599 TaxID=1123029 RepID=A0A1M7Z894_9HYPH|nr:SDR family oxidoreductase [Pseudoxanthobacter soli]SHO61138.1 NAD(P)-dependent dehydrogenase, short-chain alcohol dehydrogenase family [Pseudoxanthobacter soli DSM 19599]
MLQKATYSDLAGKTVFITGGGSGIGAALTEAFVLQGSKVAFVDIAEEPSRALVERLERETGRAPLFMPCDIRDVAALQAAIARAGEELGDIGVLLNNAANDQRHKPEDVTVEYWDDRMAINIRPMFFAIQAVVPQMKRLGGGSIVNFGSVSWMIPQGGMPAYTTAKSAVQGLTRGLARDYGPFRIRLNMLVPGWVMTERQLTLWVTPEGEAEIDRNQCIKDRVMPEDIADMALFLGSDASSKCTSQEFIVDGGWI